MIGEFTTGIGKVVHKQPLNKEEVKAFEKIAAIILGLIVFVYVVQMDIIPTYSKFINAKNPTDNLPSLDGGTQSGGNGLPQKQGLVGETPRPTAATIANSATATNCPGQTQEERERQKKVGLNTPCIRLTATPAATATLKVTPPQQEDSLDQRITTNEWYPVGLENPVEFTPYGDTIVTIKVPDKKGYSVGVTLSESDSKPLQKNMQLQVQLRYKNTATGQIVYGKREGQGGSIGIGEMWISLLGNVDPGLVQWQPIFSLKDISPKKIRKGNLQ